MSGQINKPYAIIVHYFLYIYNISYLLPDYGQQPWVTSSLCLLFNNISILYIHVHVKGHRISQLNIHWHIYIYQWIVIHWLTGKIFKIPTCFCGKLYPTVRFYLLPHAILYYKATVLGTFIAEMGGGGGEEPIGLSNYL